MTLKCPHCGEVVVLRLGVEGQVRTATDPVAEERVVSTSRTANSKRRKYLYEDERFEEFWKVYPIRRGKADAYRRWLEVRSAGIDPSFVISAAERYARWCKRNPDRYVKHAEGWLNGGRWDDEIFLPADAGQGDPAYIVGTPQYEARILAEENRAIEEMRKDDDG